MQQIGTTLKCQSALRLARSRSCIPRHPVKPLMPQAVRQSDQRTETSLPLQVVDVKRSPENSRTLVNTESSLLPVRFYSMMHSNAIIPDPSLPMLQFVSFFSSHSPTYFFTSLLPVDQLFCSFFPHVRPNHSSIRRSRGHCFCPAYSSRRPCRHRPPSEHRCFCPRSRRGQPPSRRFHFRIPPYILFRNW